MAFHTPAGEWQLAAHYLAGDVVGKLDDALAAATADARFERNVEALRAVQPTPLTAAEITPEFGVTWLEPDDIAAFVADHDGGDVTVKYHPPTGMWSYDGWAPGGPARFRTDRNTMIEQVIRACNAKPVTVHVKQQVGDREITVVDPEATAAEQLCRDNLTEALQVWCWAEPERATRLAGRYNRLFNRYRAEQWDGSHLTLPGLVSRLHATPAPEGRRVADPRLGRPWGADGPRRRGRQDRSDDHRRPRDPPDRADRRHRPVRRPREHGRAVRPRLPAPVSGRPGAHPAGGDAEGRGARVRRPDGHR